MNLKAMSAAVAAMLAAGLLFAQDGDPGAPQGQPQGQQQGQDAPDGQYETGRAVGRISVLSGDVSVRRGDSGDVVAAAMNAPLVADDRLLTGSSSRAEVQLDYANVVRVGPGSEVRFIGMDVKSYQLQLAAGTVTFRVLRPSQAQAEIDTPSVAIHPLRQGIYRVTVRDDGTSQVTVRNGEAEVFSQAGSERLQAGQTMDARGPATDPEFQVVQAVPADAWDRWNDDRDRYLERSQSYQHVSPSISGAEDLDQYGQWVNDPTYGSVWAPTVGTDWAPYRAGRWVWEDWYGWTWVSSDPWGWAPYHYGRWYHASFGWAWYPGPRFGHYYWRPALVGFFGWGGYAGGGFGFGFANVGWVPLAPFEPFHPWYGRGFYGGGYRNINIINNTNIVNVYRNARVSNGIVGMRSEEFGRTGVNRGNFLRASQADVARAGMVRGQLPLTPSRESTQFTSRAVNTQGLPRTAENRQFVSSRPAAQINRVPFEQQRQSMTQGFTQQGPRGVSGGNGFNNGNGFNGGSNGVVQNNGGQNGGSQGTFRPQSSPGVVNNSANGGWQRFNGTPAGNQQPRILNNGDGNPTNNNGFATRPGSGRFEGGPQGFNGPSAAPQSGAPLSNGGRIYNLPAPGGQFGGNRPSVVQPSVQPGNVQPQSRPAPQNYAPAAPAGRFGAEPRNFSQQQPVRISPPIVTNRRPEGGGSFNRGGGNPAPRNQGGGGGGSRGGGGGGGNRGGGGGGNRGGRR